MKREKVLRTVLPAVLALAALAPGVSADFTNPQVPAFRGQSDTEFAGWEHFTSAFNGDNLPDEAQTTSLNSAIRQIVPGAILTGGNIYNPAGPSSFRLADVVSGDLQELVLQTSTKGVELIYDNVELVYLDGWNQEVSVPFTSRMELANQSSMGVDVETLFSWDLSAIGDNVQAYELRFDAEGPHMSLDAVLLDTRYSSGVGSAFCFGDGSGASCPCGNVGANGHGCANSSGASGARMVGIGSSIAANGDLVLAVSDLPATIPGLFFQGEQNVNGGLGATFGDGLRCAGGPVVRLQVAISDGSGNAQSSVDLASVGGVLPGDSRTYQFWYRDPNGSPCNGEFNTTNGLALTWN